MSADDRPIVYIRLLGEGTPVARPTYAERVSDGVFRVLPTADYSPDDEIWEFPPGTLVRCEKRHSPDGEETLLAVEAFRGIA